MQKSSVINVFIVATPLQYLSAESIVKNFENRAENHLFYTKPDLSKSIDRANWDSVQDLFPSKLLSGKKGVLRNINVIRKNIEKVSKICEYGSEIRLHAAQIFRPEQNFIINHLYKNYSNARICVRIIPDGLLNVTRNPYKKATIFRRYYKKLLGIVFPDLSYYSFKGDRIGTDDQIVDKVYVLPNFPHEYIAQKVVYLPSLVNSKRNANELGDTALVIGQPLFKNGLMSQADRDSVAIGISRFLMKEGFSKIKYKAHPADKNNEFKSKRYEDLHIDETLEEHLSCNEYGMIIGVFSTSLLTAKTIVSDSTRVVSYGLNRCHFINESQKRKVINPFQILKVEIIDD